jgi:hypothetical protein
VRLPHLIYRAAAILCGFWALTLTAANDSRPVVGPGATKDDVINAYGWPNGQSHTGTKEILSYSQGEVILENGRVERVNFSPDVPWQAPKPRPGSPSASTRKVSTEEAPVDFWYTKFSDALTEAQRRNARILAVFTGSDWSPPSRTFHEQVENHPDFVNAFTGDFVFVQLDYPRGSPVPAKISDENLKLRDLYDVTTYPTILLLSSSGELLARVDLTKGDPAASFRDRVIAAVREARDSIPAPAVTPAPPTPVAKPAPAPTPVAAETAVAPSNSDAAAEPASGGSGSTATAMAPSFASRAVFRAGTLIALAVVAGSALVFSLWWLLWRQPQPKEKVPSLDIAERIDAAAGGLPAPAEMSAWSKEKLCAITARLAEFDNYAARLRPPGGDIDIELSKRGDLKPRVLVMCAAGSEGIVSAKRLRELFGSLAAEGAESGWFVSPAGFSAESRDYAAAHRIVLVGTEGLHNLMREVPPVSLPGILALG